MTGLYGEKWTNQYGEWSATNPTIAIWGAALKGLTEEQIKKGLNAVCDSGSPFAPTAPEFKKMCLPETQHWEHRKYELMLEESERLARLPKPPRDKSKGLEELRKIREKLK